VKHLLSGLVAFAFFCGANAQAQSLLVEYYALLGPADAASSRGAKLDDLCAIIQQDRANWHRFNKRDEFDRGDTFFTSSDRRAMIAGKCDYDRSYYANPGQRIRSGERSFFVHVLVYGSGNQITRVVVREGAG